MKAHTASSSLTRYTCMLVGVVLGVTLGIYVPCPPIDNLTPDQAMVGAAIYDVGLFCLLIFVRRQLSRRKENRS